MVDLTNLPDNDIRLMNKNLVELVKKSVDGHNLANPVSKKELDNLFEWWDRYDMDNNINKYLTYYKDNSDWTNTLQAGITGNDEVNVIRYIKEGYKYISIVFESTTATFDDVTDFLKETVDTKKTKNYQYIILMQNEKTYECKVKLSNRNNIFLTLDTLDIGFTYDQANDANLEIKNLSEANNLKNLNLLIKDKISKFDIADLVSGDVVTTAAYYKTDLPFDDISINSPINDGIDKVDYKYATLDGLVRGEDYITTDSANKKIPIKTLVWGNSISKITFPKFNTVIISIQDKMDYQFVNVFDYYNEAFKPFFSTAITINANSKNNFETAFALESSDDYTDYVFVTYESNLLDETGTEVDGGVLVPQIFCLFQNKASGIIQYKLSNYFEDTLYINADGKFDYDLKSYNNLDVADRPNRLWNITQFFRDKLKKGFMPYSVRNEDLARPLNEMEANLNDLFSIQISDDDTDDLEQIEYFALVHPDYDPFIYENSMITNPINVGYDIEDCYYPNTMQGEIFRAQEDQLINPFTNYDNLFPRGYINRFSKTEFKSFKPSIDMSLGFRYNGFDKIEFPKHEISKISIDAYVDRLLPDLREYIGDLGDINDWYKQVPKITDRFDNGDFRYIRVYLGEFGSLYCSSTKSTFGQEIRDKNSLKHMNLVFIYDNSTGYIHMKVLDCEMDDTPFDMDEQAAFVKTTFNNYDELNTKFRFSKHSLFPIEINDFNFDSTMDDPLIVNYDCIQNKLKLDNRTCNEIYNIIYQDNYVVGQETIQPDDIPRPALDWRCDSLFSSSKNTADLATSSTFEFYVDKANLGTDYHTYNHNSGVFTESALCVDEQLRPYKALYVTTTDPKKIMEDGWKSVAVAKSTHSVMLIPMYTQDDGQYYFLLGGKKYVGIDHNAEVYGQVNFKFISVESTNLIPDKNVYRESGEIAADHKMIQPKPTDVVSIYLSQAWECKQALSSGAVSSNPNYFGYGGLYLDKDGAGTKYFVYINYGTGTSHSPNDNECSNIVLDNQLRPYKLIDVHNDPEGVMEDNGWKDRSQNKEGKFILTPMYTDTDGKYYFFFNGKKCKGVTVGAEVCGKVEYITSSADGWDLNVYDNVYRESGEIPEDHKPIYPIAADTAIVPHPFTPPSYDEKYHLYDERYNYVTPLSVNNINLPTPTTEYLRSARSDNLFDWWDDNEIETHLDKYIKVMKNGYCSLFSGNDKLFDIHKFSKNGFDYISISYITNTLAFDNTYTDNVDDYFEKGIPIQRSNIDEDRYTINTTILCYDGVNKITKIKHSTNGKYLLKCDADGNIIWKDFDWQMLIDDITYARNSGIIDRTYQEYYYDNDKSNTDTTVIDKFNEYLVNINIFVAQNIDGFTITSMETIDHSDTEMGNFKAWRYKQRYSSCKDTSILATKITGPFYFNKLEFSTNYLSYNNTAADNVDTAAYTPSVIIIDDDHKPYKVFHMASNDPKHIMDSDWTSHRYSSYYVFVPMFTDPESGQMYWMFKGKKYIGPDYNAELYGDVVYDKSPWETSMLLSNKNYIYWDDAAIMEDHKPIYPGPEDKLLTYDPKNELDRKIQTPNSWTPLKKQLAHADNNGDVPFNSNKYYIDGGNKHGVVLDKDRKPYRLFYVMDANFTDTDFTADEKKVFLTYTTKHYCYVPLYTKADGNYYYKIKGVEYSGPVNGAEVTEIVSYLKYDLNASDALDKILAGLSLTTKVLIDPTADPKQHLPISPVDEDVILTNMEVDNPIGKNVALAWKCKKRHSTCVDKTHLASPTTTAHYIDKTRLSTDYYVWNSNQTSATTAAYPQSTIVLDEQLRPWKLMYTGSDNKKVLETSWTTKRYSSHYLLIPMYTDTDGEYYFSFKGVKYKGVDCGAEIYGDVVYLTSKYASLTIAAHGYVESNRPIADHKPIYPLPEDTPSEYAYSDLVFTNPYHQFDSRTHPVRAVSFDNMFITSYLNDGINTKTYDYAPGNYGNIDQEFDDYLVHLRSFTNWYDGSKKNKLKGCPFIANNPVYDIKFPDFKSHVDISLFDYWVDINRNIRNFIQIPLRYWKQSINYNLSCTNFFASLKYKGGTNTTNSHIVGHKGQVVTESSNVALFRKLYDLSPINECVYEFKDSINFRTVLFNIPVLDVLANSLVATVTSNMYNQATNASYIKGMLVQNKNTGEIRQFYKIPDDGGSITDNIINFDLHTSFDGFNITVKGKKKSVYNSGIFQLDISEDLVCEGNQHVLNDYFAYKLLIDKVRRKYTGYMGDMRYYNNLPMTLLTKMDTLDSVAYSYMDTDVEGRMQDLLVNNRTPFSIYHVAYVLTTSAHAADYTSNKYTEAKFKTFGVDMKEYTTLFSKEALNIHPRNIYGSYRIFLPSIYRYKNLYKSNDLFKYFDSLSNNNDMLDAGFLEYMHFLSNKENTPDVDPVICKFQKGSYKYILITMPRQDIRMNVTATSKIFALSIIGTDNAKAYKPVTMMLYQNTETNEFKYQEIYSDNYTIDNGCLYTFPSTTLTPEPLITMCERTNFFLMKSIDIEKAQYGEITNYDYFPEYQRIQWLSQSDNSDNVFEYPLPMSKYVTKAEDFKHHRDFRMSKKPFSWYTNSTDNTSFISAFNYSKALSASTTKVPNHFHWLDINLPQPRSENNSDLYDYLAKIDLYNTIEYDNTILNTDALKKAIIKENKLFTTYFMDSNYKYVVISNSHTNIMISQNRDDKTINVTYSLLDKPKLHMSVGNSQSTVIDNEVSLDHQSTNKAYKQILNDHLNFISNIKDGEVIYNIDNIWNNKLYDSKLNTWVKDETLEDFTRVYNDQVASLSGRDRDAPSSYDVKKIEDYLVTHAIYTKTFVPILTVKIPAQEDAFSDEMPTVKDLFNYIIDHGGFTDYIKDK